MEKNTDYCMDGIWYQDKKSALLDQLTKEIFEAEETGDWGRVFNLECQVQYIANN